ncbi:MAG: carboxypeptidase regulatory-like domain-containing protein [Phycisphaerales bacterium]|nr:carboxypeptidase regulatory-like domain-containing protein [Phycisphaerales bacterium]
MLYGQAATPGPNGGFNFSNVAAPDVFGASGPGSPADGLSDDLYRLTGVRVSGGAARYVYSTSPFRITANGTESVAHTELTFTNTPPPLPESIDLQIADPVIATNGVTTLTTTANLTQGSPVPVTSAEAWTVYRSSNVNIASIVQVGTGPTAVVEVHGHSAGTAFITARNGGATSVRRIIVDYPGNLIPTTVEGYVRLSDGQPVVGANVSVVDYTDSGTSMAPDGKFSFVLDPVPASALITVRATTPLQAGVSAPVAVVPGGTTDAGIITIETDCDSPWFKGFNHGTFDASYFNAMAIFDDDGAGPNPPTMFVGGAFSTAGGAPANNIAKWDNGTWVPLIDADSCIPGPSFCVNGVNGEVTDLEVVDLGDGPALYAVGYFIMAGGKGANKVAKWDGTRWSVLGVGVGDSHAFAWSVSAFNDGSGNGTELYVGGNFRTAGTFVNGAPDPCILPNCVDADRIAKWNRTTQRWAPVGLGFNTGNNGGDVWALKAFDADGTGPAPAYLYAGGAFYLADNAPAENIARWNGSTWTQPGGGLPGAFGEVVTSLTLFDDGSGTALFAGGSFQGPGGMPATRGVAKWNGTAWLPLGGGLDGTVQSLVGWNDAGTYRLFASGSVIDPPGAGPNVYGIAQWNGTQWTPLDQGLDTFGRDMMVWDHGAGPMLHVAGESGGGMPGLDIKPGSDPRSTNALRARDGSRPQPAGDVGGSISQGWIATWKNNEWGVLGKGLNNEVLLLTTLDPDGAGAGEESLYAGGMFTPPKGPRDENAAPFPIAAVARFDDTRWRSVGNGFTLSTTTPAANLQALVAFDDDAGGANPTTLFAGGFFNRTKNAAGTTVNLSNVARWTGAEWAPAGPISGAGSLNSNVTAMAVYDPDGAGAGVPALFAGGAFTNRIARWMPGASPTWSNTPTGVTGVINAMAVFNNELYIGGNFLNVGGISAADYLAKWNGTAWSAVVAGLNNPVYTLAVFDDDGAGPIQSALYVGGSFTAPGSPAANRVGRWSGSAWSALGAGLGASTNAVLSLTGFENADGRFLYAGGDFNMTTPVALSRLAKWNPILLQWSDVASGVTGDSNVAVRALAGYDDGMVGPTLFVGGHFDAAGGPLTINGVTAGNVARFGCTSAAPKMLRSPPPPLVEAPAPLPTPESQR